MKRLAIFASGSGSNAENICSFFSDSLDVKIVLIGSNNNAAYVLKRAAKLKIPTLIFSKSELNSFSDLSLSLSKKKVDYIVLAGFLLKIPEKMIALYSKKIINIHPSLLPKYGGKGMYGDHVHRAVLKNKEKESGITVHLVNKQYDSGRVLFQKSCPVYPKETLDSLSKKIRFLEHKYFPETINSFIRK